MTVLDDLVPISPSPKRLPDGAYVSLHVEIGEHLLDVTGGKRLALRLPDDCQDVFREILLSQRRSPSSKRLDSLSRTQGPCLRELKHSERLREQLFLHLKPNLLGPHILELRLEIGRFH